MSSSTSTYIQADKFVDAQLHQLQTHGQFIAKTAIAPGPGAPTTLEGVTFLLKLLQRQCGTKAGAVVLITRAVAFQSKWHFPCSYSGAGGDQNEKDILWNLQFFKSMEAANTSPQARNGYVFVLNNSWLPHPGRIARSTEKLDTTPRTQIQITDSKPCAEVTQIVRQAAAAQMAF